MMPISFAPFRYLLGRHNRALEAYKQAETKAEKPDWEIHYNLGTLAPALP